ncbi:RagB/SusD family nutrient uptake outer membrane protein [Pedobacter immunditicola]|uniref:RagB/SusD family nutrient uptake outer membrane protein n=1 Tax=Pedobacter immunditicola TaxID=3133440 RepID=UPI0030A0A9EF
MKNYKLSINVFLLLLLFTSCKKTSILDSSPQDKYSDALLWADINLVDAYLLDTYHGIRMGFTQTLLSSVSDETHESFTHGPEIYVAGSTTADNTSPWDGGEYNFTAWSDYFLNIQKLNTFISKIDQVADAYPATDQAAIKSKSDVMKGEALFLRAYCYGQLVRIYGGVPLMKEPAKLGDDFNSILRGTFEETINFIVGDCDAANSLLLDKDETVLGRATKGAALALKSRTLLFAASDLTADGSAKSKYVGYVSPNRNALWLAAKNAAKAVIDLQDYQLANFGAPDKAEVSKNYYIFFKTKDLSNSEIIWGKMYSKSSGDVNQMNQWNGGNGWDQWASNAPLQNLVDSYQMEDGTDFSSHFKVDAQGLYQNISDKYTSADPYQSRDPRFYGSILYDGAPWRPRPASLQPRDPIGNYDRRTRIVINNGTTVSTTFGLDTRQGPVSPWNGSFTGYVMKKMVDDGVNFNLQNNENAWIEFRYAEVLLNYAEASLELGENGEATNTINQIRNRAGMANFVGDAKMALRYERKIELVFENSRWYDIRRWKILEQTLTDALGVDITETNTNGVVKTAWKQISVEKRQAKAKMYWIPIPNEERRKAPQLEQNPEY